MRAIDYDGMTSVEVLNFFRNCYYADGNNTENGIVANAINDILPTIEVPRWIPVTERPPTEDDGENYRPMTNYESECDS